MLVVHPHLHRRRTGVTAHTEAVVRALGDSCEVRVFGGGVDPALPRIGFREVFRRAGRERVVWHAHRNEEIWPALLLRALGRRIALVVTRHASAPPSWISRWLLRRADRVIALTRVAQRQLPVPSTVVPHGVDLERFSPPVERRSAKDALALPGGQVVGVVGRIRQDKGQGDFADAVAPLLEQHPDWAAVLVGLAKPREADWARGLVARTGGRLHLVGEQRDVAAWYRGLTVVVQPSHAESFSLVLVEAMAAGCCVIAARLPHYPELLEDGRTGLLYPVGDVAALRAQLSRVMREPGLAERLGRAAADHARTHFGIQHETLALRALYRDVLGG